MQDNLLRPITLPEQIRERRFAVDVEPLLGRSAAALSIAAIIESQNRRSGGDDLANVRNPVCDVAGVAVEEERNETRVFAVNPPGMQPNSIRRVQPDIARTHLRLQIPKSLRIPAGMEGGAIRN